MALTTEEIRNKITEQSKRATIVQAVLHQNRLKFHAQTQLAHVETQPVSDFFSWVANLIPDDKYKIFKSLFRYPVKTNEICGVCFDRLSRIFDGRNPAINYEFYNTELKADWDAYRKERLQEPVIWQTKGWEIFKTDINAVLIVDMPTGNTTGKAEPYFYWLDIASVIDYETNEKGEMEYIIFHQPEKRIAVIDANSYRMYAEDGSGNVGELLIERAHALGYTPARFFWSQPISLAQPDIKESPLSRQLEALDWYLFFHTSKRHLDLYGSYPIYSGYEKECDYVGSNGEYCDGGYLRSHNNEWLYDSASALQKCPKCGDKRIAGAGSFIEVPIPTGDQPDLADPVKILQVDVNSLDFNVKEEERLKNSIITAVVGIDNEAINNQAVNEKQVEATFENQSAILNRVKKGFEEAQKFVDDTICRLRYGNQYIGSNINYGTEFFTLSVADLRERYKTAKESGASEAELDALQMQILETENRNNPQRLQRMLILAELEPYRHHTRQEVIDLYKENLIDETTLRIKLRFADLIRRFERENTNVVEFGSETEFYKKIDTIYQTLINYVTN